MAVARREIQALLARLADGDRTAIEPAFDELWPLLVRFSLRALGHPEDAEDAAQQALAKIFEQVVDFDRSHNGVAWALAICAFECRTLRKKRKRRREEALDAEAPRADDAHTPEEALIERDLEDAAREALGALREADARAILAAIAETRPRADATFRKRLQRAFARLREAWREKHEAEE